MTDIELIEFWFKVRKPRLYDELGLTKEDLISEMWLVLTKCKERFDESRGFKLHTFAFKAMNRRWADIVKKHERRDRYKHFEFIEHPARPDNTPYFLPLLQAIDELPGAQRWVMVETLRGKTCEDMAEFYGCTRSYINQIRREAVARLRNTGTLRKLYAPHGIGKPARMYSTPGGPSPRRGVYAA